MRWTLTDRATRAAFWGCLALAGLALLPFFLGYTSIGLMAAVLMLVYQAWRLALARVVDASLDDDGITKKLGHHSWRLGWQQVTAARQIRFLGAPQLILSAADEVAWNASDRLWGRLPAGDRALQVPAGQWDEIRARLVEHGVVPPDRSGPSGSTGH